MPDASLSKPFHTILLPHLTFKRIIIFILLLIFCLVCALYILSWYYNHSISAPLPIDSELNTLLTSNKTNSSVYILHIVAAESLQPALIAIIERFHRHHPDIEVKVRYIDPTNIRSAKQITTQPIDLLLIPREMSTELKSYFNATPNPITAPSTQTVDEFVANAKSKNQTIASNDNRNSKQINTTSPAATNTHYWEKFDFALQGQNFYQSRLLNDQEASILFSQFLLTSNSQDDFVNAGLQSIDSYRHRMEDHLNLKAVLPVQIPSNRQKQLNSQVK